MWLAIRNLAIKHAWLGGFDVTGYTSFKTNLKHSDDAVTFYANELLHGNKWYDYAMIQFEEVDVARDQTISPARILGFFKYNTTSVPTPHYLDEEKLSPSTIFDQSLQDPNMYVVVHSATTYIPWSTVTQNFVTTFKLGPLSTHLYIVKVESIVRSLFVWRNYGGIETNVEKYFCALPSRDWGDYFGDRIDMTDDDDYD